LQEGRLAGGAGEPEDLPGSDLMKKPSREEAVRVKVKAFIPGFLKKRPGFFVSVPLSGKIEGPYQEGLWEKPGFII
jgi:hypothetical protein